MLRMAGIMSQTQLRREECAGEGSLSMRVVSLRVMATAFLRPSAAPQSTVREHGHRQGKPLKSTAKVIALAYSHRDSYKQCPAHTTAPRPWDWRQFWRSIVLRAD